MASTREIQERIETFVRELAEEFGAVDDSNALSWLDAVETRAVELSDAVARGLMQQQLANRPVEEAEPTCPQCGQSGRYRGSRERPLVTRRGPLTISEPEYYCPCCRKAFFPADASDRR
jgi:hypothetical protein